MSANSITIKKGLPSFITNEKSIQCHEGCSFDIVAGINNSYKGSGKLYATNYRLIFLKENPTTLFSSFNIPYKLVSKYKMKKKMFGGPVISGYVSPITNGGLNDEGKFHITFKQSSHTTEMFKISEEQRKKYHKNSEKGHDIVAKAAQLPIQEIFPEQFPNYFKNRKKKKLKSKKNLIKYNSNKNISKNDNINKNNNKNDNNNNNNNNNNSNNNKKIEKVEKKKSKSKLRTPSIVRHISVPIVPITSNKSDTDDDFDDFDSSFNESKSDNSNFRSPRKLKKRQSQTIIVSQSRTNAPLSLGKDKLTKEAKLFSSNNKKKSHGPVIGASPVDLNQWRKRKKKTVITDRPEEEKKPKIYSPPISDVEGVNEAYQDPSNPHDILLTVNNNINNDDIQPFSFNNRSISLDNYNGFDNNGFEKPPFEPVDLENIDENIEEIIDDISVHDSFDENYQKSKNNRQRSNSLTNNKNNNNNNNKSPTMNRQKTVPVQLYNNDTTDSDDDYDYTPKPKSKLKSQPQPINGSIKNNTNNSNNIKNNNKKNKSRSISKRKLKYKDKNKQLSQRLLDETE